MSRMVCFAVASVLLLGAGSGLAEEPEPSAIDEIFADYDSTASPGCSLGVYRDGEIVYSRGYGMANLEYGIANAPDTVFRIGSTSKQFTATAIALLAEAGKLSLDDDIRTFFPRIPDYGSPVTVRHLVHHTSGIRDYLVLTTFADWTEDFSIQEAVAMIVRQRELNFESGEEHLYSNSGYFLMSQIVERVTGQSLHIWADENIFGPLGMKNTHFHDDHTHIVPNRADGYEPAEDGFRISMTILDMVGDGGVFTTVEDLLPWERNFSNNRLGKGTMELIDLIQTPGTLDGGEATSYAFGLGVGEFRGVPEIAHGGAFVGFRAGFNRYPDQRLGVAVLCNFSTTNPTGLARQVAELYLADVIEGDAESSEAKASTEAEVVEVPRATLDRYSGEYWHPENGMIRTIVSNDDGVHYDRGGGSTTQLAPLGDDRFQMVGVGVEVIVGFEGRGAPRRMTVAVEGQEPLTLDRLERWKPSREELGSLAGTYYSPELEHTQTIALEENRLTASRRSGPTELEPIVSGTLSAEGAMIVFERDGKGRVTGYRLSAGRVKNLRYDRRP